MTLPTKELPAPKRLVGKIQANPYVQENPSIQENPSYDTTRKDPLIARDLEQWQYIGILVLAVGTIAIVGFFSRRVEYALLFATALSVVLIIFFLTA